MKTSVSSSTAGGDVSPRLVHVFERLLALFAAWTVAYDLVALLRWPCYTIGILAIPLAAAAWIVGTTVRRRIEATPRVARPEPPAKGVGVPRRTTPFAAGSGTCHPSSGTCQPPGGKGDRHLLPERPSGCCAQKVPVPFSVYAVLTLMGASMAVLTAVVNRLDYDDVAYLRRVVVQTTALDSPVIVSNVTYDMDMPDIAGTQYLTSYEMAIGFTARVLHCDLVNLYYNVFPMGIAFLVPWAYYLLFRALGLDARMGVLAAFGAMLFLMLDGNTQRSPGNYAFVRLWQGKCVLITLALPVTLLFAWRFLRQPSRATWYPVFLAGIGAVGLTACGLFLMPGLALALSLAYVLGGRALAAAPLAARCRTAVGLNLAMFYPVGLSLILFLGLLPLAQGVVLLGDRQTWLDQVGGFGDARSLVCYAALLVVGPWLVLPASSARVLTGLPLVVGALFFTPLTGPFLARTLATTYFRLGYLCPVAAGAGLAFASLGRLPADLLAGATAGTSPRLRFGLVIRRPRAAATIGAMVVVGCLVGLHLRTFTFSVGNHPSSPYPVAWKPPLADRFARPVSAFAHAVSSQLDDAVVLAPGDVAIALSLLNPRTRFAITQPYYSEWSFEMIGQKHQGWLRNRAQAFVAGSPSVPGGAESLRAVAGQSVNAIVVAPEADCAAVEAVLAQSGGLWSCAANVAGFRLFLR